jgi:N-acetylneuraminate synthase/N,N'-diacetyllegionaminate synthase
MARTGKPLIVSTGAATLDEVVRAARWLGDHADRVALMQCVSSYPTPDESAAIAAMAPIARATGLPVGYSDHTAAVDTGALAVAAGACLLEKHVTYRRTAIGPDHAASLEPDDFAEYVRLAHRARAMLGSGSKHVMEIERDVRHVSRQSLTAAAALPAGHRLLPGDVTVKRPGTGVPAYQIDHVLGRALRRAVEADMPLTEEDLA